VRTSKPTIFNFYKGYAMKTKLATAGLLMGALLLPVVGYTAEKAPAGPPSSATDTAPQPATKGRSDQPVDDSVITTKVKALFVKDKHVRARDVEVKTVNGVVELSGTVRSKNEASRAASIARKVKGVKSVKNDLQVAEKPAASAPEKMSDKDRPATTQRSDRPVADSVITTKVKALFVKDKEVSFRTIEVKTVNGVGHLGGTAKSKQEAGKAVSMARDVKGVNSVQNDIRVQ
jgi:osmotically-inducible protein OsmY